ncbi:MAG: UDP-N-acetylglucosamine 1-carboxyvinyltransferase [Clostridium sp.]|jgi:UDP-N-acetylglucosamine 1-carboxyvinyltransferase|nr:UDP-N-acetylglucosamine 1-carboxyvinyltransferase [Clostridium sp.]
MDSIHIHGGVGLQGKVRIQGSKNAALPILAATILTKECNLIHNCPRIADVYQMLNLLRSIGCAVSWEGDGVRVNAGNVNLSQMPEEAITGMRSSLFLMGALLGRTGEVVMEYPGGCAIGERPIDLTLSSLRRMGVLFCETEGEIQANTPNGLQGATVELPLPSVGATENVILAAVLAQGRTLLKNAAREPEVETLCRYLLKCGARMEGIGSGEIRMEGVSRLSGTEFTIPADRIVAGTYLFGTLGTGGNVLLEEAPVEHMETVIDLAVRMGAECQVEKEGLYIQAPERLRQLPFLETRSYPGFPTDLQSLALAVCTGAKGQCLVHESIFENRFRVVGPLQSMGANIFPLDAKRILVRGVTPLCGREVEAEELRGGAALVVAGLMADGETVIRGRRYIDRGYENICKDLRELGARIYTAQNTDSARSSICAAGYKEGGTATCDQVFGKRRDGYGR